MRWGLACRNGREAMLGRSWFKVIQVVFLTGFIIFATQEASQAAVGQWSQIGPSGGTVYSIAIDPSNTSIIYAGTRGGVYKSTNGGHTWSNVSRGINSPSGIFGIAIDPNNTNVLYATGNDVFKSTDGGASWAVAGTDKAGDQFYSVVVDPANSNIIYVGSMDGPIKSTTAGEGSWISMLNNLQSVMTNFYAIQFRAVAIDPTDDNIIYTDNSGSIGSGVYRSPDAGVTWSASSTDLTNLSGLTINALLINPDTHTTLYAATSAGIFVSTNSGGNWTPLNTGLTNLSVNSIAMDPSDHSVLYVGTNGGGIFKSTNAGAEWSALSNAPNSSTTYGMTMVPGSPGMIYAGTNNGGVIESTDGGNTWSSLNTGLDAWIIDSIAVDKTAPNTAYAGAEYGGLLKTTNGGATWSSVDSTLGAGSEFIGSIAIDPTNDSTIYAGISSNISQNPQGVYKSTNGGAYWSEKNTGLNGYTSNWVNSLSIDPDNPSTLFATVGSTGIFRSADGADTWTEVYNIASGDDVYCTAIDPSDSSVVYAGLNSAIIKSVNGGMTWTPLPNSPGLVFSIAIDPSNPNILYASGQRYGIYRSEDGGQSWTAVYNTYGAQVWSVVINPITPSTIYAGTASGIYISTDHGTTWTIIDTGLLYEYVQTLAINSGGLFAGTSGASLFKYQPVSGSKLNVAIMSLLLLK